MKGLYRYFHEIIVGFWSLILGYSVTLRELVKPIITVQYPRVKLEMDPAYRGHIELKRLVDEGHFCVACGTCVRACPSNVIKVQGIKSEAASGKMGMLFLIDYSRCSLCGICVEVCPVDALCFSMEYELAHFSRWDSVIDLHARFKEQQAQG